MKIKTKRVYEPVARGDGKRVLVDRLWPRGIAKKDVPVWLKEIAPSEALRKWFHHEPRKWSSFRAKYRKELADNPDAVQALKHLVKRGTVTLLYGAKDTEHNQAVVLADFLKPRKRPVKRKKPA
jgi:uncharacterized protein YeaO (DUF488 family)